MNSILIGREKKEKTIKRHTKLRSAVYSNSLAMTNQKVSVITTRIGAMTFRWHFAFYLEDSSLTRIFEIQRKWPKLKIAGVFFLINRHTAFNTLILYCNDWRLPYHVSILIYIFTFHELRIKSRFVLICRGQFFHFYFFYLCIYWFWHTIFLLVTFFLKCL